MLVPKLYAMGNSRPSIKINGTTVLFRLRNSTTRLQPTAHSTYSGISWSIRDLVSAKIADIPPIKQSLRRMLLISPMACMVSALALVPSNCTSSMVAPVLL